MLVSAEQSGPVVLTNSRRIEPATRMARIANRTGWLVGYAKVLGYAKVFGCNQDDWLEADIAIKPTVGMHQLELLGWLMPAEKQLCISDVGIESTASSTRIYLEYPTIPYKITIVGYHWIVGWLASWLVGERW